MIKCGKGRSCLDSAVRRFQLYFSHNTATAHINHVFPRFHKYKAWALKCLARGHTHQKSKGSRGGSNPGDVDYESNTTPLILPGPKGHRQKSNINTCYGLLIAKVT